MSTDDYQARQREIEQEAAALLAWTPADHVAQACRLLAMPYTTSDQDRHYLHAYASAHAQIAVAKAVVVQRGVTS